MTSRVELSVSIGMYHLSKCLQRQIATAVTSDTRDLSDMVLRVSDMVLRVSLGGKVEF